MSRDAFSLAPVSPFRLDLTVWRLRRRPDNVLDRWDGQTYRRVLPLLAGLVEIAIPQVEPPETPRLRVSVEGQPLRSSFSAAVTLALGTLALGRLLGLWRVDLISHAAGPACGSGTPAGGSIRDADGPHRSRRYRTYRQEIIPMTHEFKAGDHVEWNSEAGRVRGTIKKEIFSAIKFEGYTVRASKEEPQYLIKSDTTDHLAMHKGSAPERINKKKLESSAWNNFARHITFSSRPGTDVTWIA